MTNSATSRRRFISAIGASCLCTGISQSAFTRALAANKPAFTTITAKTGMAPITNGRTEPTAIWGYNGEVPGPLLRIDQGDTLRVRLLNELEQPTSVHWHGIRIDNRMDGSPLVQVPVEPGGSFDYEFEVPDAGTYWYHTHTRGYEQLTRGLYGVLIVDEKTPITDQYDDDMLLLFDDWRLDDNGQIEEQSIGAMMHKSHAGRMGNWGSVNGLNKPDLTVKRGSRIRARALNVCNARVLNIAFGDLHAWVVAHDGQPTTPVAVGETLSLAPGQRTDLLIDIPVDAVDAYQIGVKVRDKTFEAATFKVSSTKASATSTSTPDAFPDNSLHSQQFDLDKAHTVKLHMQGGAMGSMQESQFQGKILDIRSLVQQGKAWAFNGISDMDKSTTPLFEVPRGTTVTIEMFNDTRWPHAMHVHGHHFRVIDTGGDNSNQTNESSLPGPWRDTHLMQPAERHTIALVADNPGDWLMHCHMVEHAASGMTGWFRVT